MSSRTSAHLTPQCDDGFKALIDRHGEDGAKIFYESHAAAVDLIEQIQNEEELGPSISTRQRLFIPCRRGGSG